MMQPIINCYNKDAKRPKLVVESINLYTPQKDWTYSHHPSITYFKGKFYAIWSNGRTNEDDVGQRILIAKSEDFYNWTEPIPLVDSLMGKHSEVVLTAAGFHIDGDKLVAYMGQYEYKPENVIDGKRTEGDRGHMDTCLKALVTTDGETWSEIVDLGIPIVPNHGPQKTKSGRLIISGNIMFPYTDDQSGLKGWNIAGIYPDNMKSNIVDDSESFWKVKEEAGWPVGLCEGSFYQTEDDVIHMMLRTNSRELWVSESYDNGSAWLEPRSTDFSDNNTKFHFGRLPDGRYYYVGCPDPEPRGARCPLVFSVSDDGYTFSRHFIIADEMFEKLFPGMYKGGIYGYPHTLVTDGYIYVIYSICKERISVLRFPCDTI